MKRTYTVEIVVATLDDGCIVEESDGTTVAQFETEDGAWEAVSKIEKYSCQERFSGSTWQRPPDKKKEGTD